MAPREGAYGEAIRAHHAGEESFEVVECDDGFVGPPGDPELYFSTSDEWAPRERAATDHAEGPFSTWVAAQVDMRSISKSRATRSSGSTPHQER